MRSLPPALALGVVLALALSATGAQTEPAPGPDITLTLDTVDVVRPPAGVPGLGFLSGRAFAHEGELELFDVVFVIDTSGSTADASGLGEHSTWLSHLPGVQVARSDSVLGAEVAAIESLLDGLDPRTTRVGLVGFAGSENPYEHNAWTDAPLTSNYTQVRKALADRLLIDPEGGTDLSAGLLRGAIELLGTRSAESQPREHAVRHLVVLTDGMPTLPLNGPVHAAIRAARKLAKHDIRVHIFAIGSEAEDAGRDIEPVAKVTRGDYHAVEDLSNLAPLLAKIEFRSLRELRVQNKTTGAPATELARDQTGAWSALVPFIAGANQLEIVAVASDGRERRLERQVVFGKVALDAEQQARRARLLALQVQAEARKKAARNKNVEIQAEPAKPAN